MALSLYRRHRRDCKGGHPEDSRSGEFEERKKNFKHCDCPIFLSGSLAKKFRRQSTAQWEWPQAHTILRQYETVDSWTGQKPILPLPEPERRRTTIEHAVKTFLTELEEHAAFATQKKYRLVLKNFEQFSYLKGFIYIDQWNPADIREFRSSWQVSPRTAPRRMSMMRSFFEYCLSNEWIERNAARLVRNPRGREVGDQRNDQKLPFTDDELKRMYAACELYGRTSAYKWNGDDLADFISLSIYTGLRISDVAQFHIERMNETGEIRLRTTKAGTHVYTWIPKWLQERIKARAAVHGPFIFGEHRSTTIDVITETWRRKLNKVWELSGPWPSKPTPHKFRHTFARILLQNPGVTVRDVAELLGNTEDMVRKRYSAWVTERQVRLTTVLQNAFADKPKPKIVAIR
jgi:integrase